MDYGLVSYEVCAEFSSHVICHCFKNISLLYVKEEITKLIRVQLSICNYRLCNLCTKSWVCINMLSLLILHELFKFWILSQNKQNSDNYLNWGNSLKPLQKVNKKIFQTF